jgi:hypothetical protein
MRSTPIADCKRKIVQGTQQSKDCEDFHGLRCVPVFNLRKSAKSVDIQRVVLRGGDLSSPLPE